MSAYNFRKQFVPLIESGEKRQTIRALRKDGRKPRAGEMLYLYTGQRTKNCRKIKEVLCESVKEIIIDKNYIQIQDKIFLFELHGHQKESFAIADGFKTYQEFQDFFEKTHGLPFYGYLIKW